MDIRNPYTVNKITHNIRRHDFCCLVWCVECAFWQCRDVEAWYKHVTHLGISGHWSVFKIQYVVSDFHNICHESLSLDGFQSTRFWPSGLNQIDGYTPKLRSRVERQEIDLNLLQHMLELKVGYFLYVRLVEGVRDRCSLSPLLVVFNLLRSND